MIFLRQVVEVVDTFMHYDAHTIDPIEALKSFP